MKMSLNYSRRRIMYTFDWKSTEEALIDLWDGPYTASRFRAARQHSLLGVCKDPWCGYMVFVDGNQMVGRMICQYRMEESTMDEMFTLPDDAFIFRAKVRLPVPIRDQYQP
jgi:hypothetical protein